MQANTKQIKAIQQAIQSEENSTRQENNVTYLSSFLISLI